MTAVAGPGDGAGRSGETVSPERTYALVVGVEHYKAGQAWGLDGPASDAARFTSWLLSRGVQADQILVFLSPDEGLPPGVPLPAGITASPARRDAVTTAITRTLPEWRGDLLWLFWAGHGVLTRHDHLRLFFADASIDDKRNLDLNSLLAALRSDPYAGLPRQIGIVDACQTYADRLHFATTLPDGTLPSASRCPAANSFSVRGQSRAGRGQPWRPQGWLFSQAVMEELTGASGDDWPPDMDLVAARLDRRFSELRATGHPGQTPTSFLASWGGREGTRRNRVPADRSAGCREGATAQRGGAARGGEPASEPQRDGRSIQPGQHPSPAAQGTRHEPAVDPASCHIQVGLLVTRCLDYPGGLAELMDAIELYAGSRGSRPRRGQGGR